MARGVRLDDLVDQLRAEVGHSTNTAVSRNSEDYLKQVLRRTQQRLWEEYDWSFLKVDRDIDLVAGQRYYSVPPDLPYDRIIEVSVRYGDRFYPLKHGVGPAEYNQYDSERGVRRWPIMKWDIAEDTGTIDAFGVIELWPIPNQSRSSFDGYVRVTGTRTIAPLQEGGDVCELDGTLIVLMAASEIQARQNQADAQLKLQQAQQLLTRLMNQSSNKKKVTKLVDGCGNDRYRPREITSVTSLGSSPGGGDCSMYIPLAGTDPGRPVTGPIVFDPVAGGGLNYSDKYGWFMSEESAGDPTYGALMMITDAGVYGPTAGELRHYLWQVSDGIEARNIVMVNDGTVQAGRPDLPAGAPGNTLITKAHLDAVIPPSGNYVPLAGTAPGTPVTGNIELDQQVALSFKNQWYIATFPDADPFDGTLTFLSDITVTGAPAAPRAVAVEVHDGTDARDIVLAPDGTVTSGRVDLPDLSDKKKLVPLGHLENGYIPLTGTVEGMPATGSIAFSGAFGVNFGPGKYGAGWDAGTETLLFTCGAQIGDPGNYGITFGVSDGTTRNIGFNRNGTVQAGRSDIPAGSSGSTLITKAHFDQNLGNGPFVPKAGGTFDGQVNFGVGCNIDPAVGTLSCVAIVQDGGGSGNLQSSNIRPIGASAQVGSSSQRFSQIHANAFYEGGTALSSKYALSSHNHDSAYLKLSGGTLTGDLVCVGFVANEVWSQTQIQIGGAAPTLNQHATRKDYVDGALMALAGILGANATQLADMQAYLDGV